MMFVIIISNDRNFVNRGKKSSLPMWWLNVVSVAEAHNLDMDTSKRNRFDGTECTYTHSATHSSFHHISYTHTPNAKSKEKKIEWFIFISNILALYACAPGFINRVPFAVSMDFFFIRIEADSKCFHLCSREESGEKEKKEEKHPQLKCVQGMQAISDFFWKWRPGERKDKQDIKKT